MWDSSDNGAVIWNNYLPLCGAIKKKRDSAFDVCGGGIFLLYHNYGGYRTQFISSWICNSFMGMAYSAGIVFFACYHEDLLEQHFEKPVSKKILRFIRYIGKASYHIFLVQQLWFCISFPLRDRIRIRYAYIIDLSICIILGCAFYFIYSLIEGRMGKKVKINPS
jgi:hypothetical protein